MLAGCIGEARFEQCPNARTLALGFRHSGARAQRGSPESITTGSALMARPVVMDSGPAERSQVYAACVNLPAPASRNDEADTFAGRAAGLQAGFAYRRRNLCAQMTQQAPHRGFAFSDRACMLA